MCSVNIYIHNIIKGHEKHMPGSQSFIGSTIRKFRFVTTLLFIESILKDLEMELAIMNMMWRICKRSSITHSVNNGLLCRTRMYYILMDVRWSDNRRRRKEKKVSSALCYKLIVVVLTITPQNHFVVSCRGFFFANKRI